MLDYPNIPMANMTKNVRYLALICHILLLFWMGLWHFVFVTESTYSPLFVFLMYLFPLILPLPGIIKGKPYTHAWVNFMILIYIIHGLTVFYTAPAERLYASIELLLALGMFTGCCFFARLRGKECGLGLGKLKDEMDKEKALFEGNHLD